MTCLSAREPEERVQSDPRRYLAVGLASVVAASAPLLLTRYSVPWDASDSYLLAFRWMGSCLREGFLCEYFPNTFSGYTLAGQPEFGVYNALYVLIAFLFPDSVLSINVLYLTLQCAEFLLCFRVGRQLGLEPIGRLSLGLCIVASGFWVGHAEHFSYLTSALSATSIFSGLLDLSSGADRRGVAMIAIGCYMLGSAGYPALMVSVALVSVLLFLRELASATKKTRMVVLALGGVILGAIAAAPAQLHFWAALARSSRLQGLSVNEVMAGSLPLYALANFLLPSWHWANSASATDISMDRFHLLHVSPWALSALILIGRATPFTSARPIAARGRFWLSLGAVLLLLSLGDNNPLPLRRWLAETSIVFRLGRWPGSEYIFFVHLFGAILSAAAVEALTRRWRLPTRGVAVLLVADFLVVMAATSGLRIQRTSSESRGTMPRFQVVYGADDKYLLQHPRDCPDSSVPNTDASGLAPHGFSWWGYSPLLPRDYVRDMAGMKWALCGSSRLWDFDTQQPIRYRLLRYTPIAVSIQFDPQGAVKILWSETGDAFWALSVNGKPSHFERGPAGLRYFRLPRESPGTVEVDMVYLGPVSRLWRESP